MLLNYLYENFYEESALMEKAKISSGQLQALTKSKIIPKPSYILDTQSDAVSFVAEHREVSTYRFHLKGHVDWIKQINRLGISTEQRAKSYFRSDYKNAAEMFFSGEFGKRLIAISPDLPAAFDETYFEKTWQYFQDGVYGVCTRDGMPASIFLKQALVWFIEGFVERFPDRDLSDEKLEALEKAVYLLDLVESEFAPHEVKNTSRQRCIIDVKTKYLRIQPQQNQ